MDFTNLNKTLERLGYAVSCFAAGADAAAYLNEQIDGKTVGFGGSVTLRELGLFDSLSAHNTVNSHWNPLGGITDALREAAHTDVYLSSVNALAETGEIINIDGTGNRVSSMLYGHDKVYLVIGRNKIAPDYDRALWRARNIAAPKNAMRLGVKTPCAVKGDRCYNCRSPQRICRALVVLWECVKSCEIEIVLVDEDLGY
ncbi:MAG: lactate utilization protein [Oscillospiraceae bacterium]|nr:lactate utilization protein [Oscillospiraceae bacterium]